MIAKPSQKSGVDQNKREELKIAASSFVPRFQADIEPRKPPIRIERQTDGNNKMMVFAKRLNIIGATGSR